MPRAARILGNDITYHVVSKCNAKELLFRTDRDFGAFLQHVEECQKALLFELHAYCLMQSHIHLILTTRRDVFLNKVMFGICQQFSYQYNKWYGREGHFWKNHYFCKVISNDIYGLVCLRYLHLNPVRGGIVKDPEKWPWSCVLSYTKGKESRFLTPLTSYLGLGNEDAIRQKYYQNWLRTRLLSQRTEFKLMETRLRVGSNRFQRLLNREVAPVLQKVSDTF